MPLPANDRRRRYVAKLRAQAEKIHGNHCVICGGEKTEMAHIKPTKLNGRSRGRNARLLDVIRNADCYAPMCGDCHYRFDRGEVELPPPRKVARR